MQYSSRIGFARLTGIVLPFMPEPPVYLVSVGEVERIERALRRLGDSSDSELQARLPPFRTNVEQSQAEVAGATYSNWLR